MIDSRFMIRNRKSSTASTSKTSIAEKTKQPPPTPTSGSSAKANKKAWNFLLFLFTYTKVHNTHIHQMHLKHVWTFTITLILFFLETNWKHSIWNVFASHIFWLWKNGDKFKLFQKNKRLQTNELKWKNLNLLMTFLLKWNEMEWYHCCVLCSCIDKFFWMIVMINFERE